MRAWRTIAAALLVARVVAGQSSPMKTESPWLDDQNLGTPLRSEELPQLAGSLLEGATRLIGRALIANRAVETLEQLCDDCGSRLSGSTGADLAVAWCLDRLTRDGFSNVHAERVMVPRWVRGHCRVTMSLPREQELAACALGGSVGTGGRPLKAAVIATPSLETLARLSPAEVRGKMVLLTRKMERDDPASGYGPTVSIRSDGASAAAKLGAVAVLIRSVGTGNARLPHTGAMNYDPGVTKIPAVALSAEDAEMLDRLIARERDVEVSLDLGCETLPDVESANVVAELPGREKPEEIVLLGGHLDSWDLGTGALDDGAGVVIAWEAARLIRELGLRPRRTLRLVLFMNEENGLRGGDGYFAEHRADLANHVAAIEADSGAGRPLGFGCTSSDGDLARVQQLGLLLRGIGAGEITKGGGGADIGPLRAAGVPTLGLRQDSRWYFDYHHTAADTPDKADPHELALNVAAMAVMAWGLAELDPRLANFPAENPPRSRR
ncbi:MAG: M20/M25/M40 family metallo-hydrolase [Planctomycetes bacterium]|nr:M20/M25/M40 family metallo-hydrolase [Planctomycetota bacterium]